MTYCIGAVLIEEAERFAGWLGSALSIVLASTTLAARDLWDHVRAVDVPLQAGDPPAARKAVAMIVGRDTAELSESEVARATVETVAESTADGVIAPLLYLSIGGAPLALAYKAVNTLDSIMQPSIVLSPRWRAADNASKPALTPPVFTSFTFTPWKHSAQCSTSAAV